MFDFNEFQEAVLRSKTTNAANKTGEGFGLGHPCMSDYQRNNSSDFFAFATIMLIFGSAWMHEISEKLDELKGDKNNGL